MPTLAQHLDLERCPHCGTDKPTLYRHGGLIEINGFPLKKWANYSCRRCGNVVLATGASEGAQVQALYPSALSVHEDVPLRPRQFLEQAISTQHAPAASVMVAASAVDAMLKEKGLVTGVLNSRIKEAADKHLITAEMAAWAHEVRLDANDQRHADQNASLPTVDDAKRVIEFAQALAQFLFVLPARVTRGRQHAQGKP